MGLDMFLSEVIRNEGQTLKPEAIYWRKANAIHNYVIQQHADGIDECQPIPLNREDLHILSRLCRLLVFFRNERLNAMILPTKSGFFFGSLEYDEDYYNDLQYTADKIDEALKDEDAEEFEYQASW